MRHAQNGMQEQAAVAHGPMADPKFYRVTTAQQGTEHYHDFAANWGVTGLTA